MILTVSNTLPGKEMILEFSSVDFSYSTHKVLDKTEFGVEQGEFVYLVGKSGCGKSTLLQMCYFNLLPDTGEVKVAGYSSKDASPKSIPGLRQKLGIVFQDFKLLSDRTVYENLAYILEINNYPSKKRRNRVETVLKELGILHLKNAYPKTLSGGEQQRTAIGRAIVNEPLLVIADEPTGNLDPQTSGEIVTLLRSINIKGTAVLLATHNYDLIDPNCRILRLEAGKVTQVRVKA